VLLVAGCASGLDRPVVTFEAAPDPQGTQHVTVHMHSFYFEPNRIVVHAGRPVEIKLMNHALAVPHNFTVSESLMSVSGDVLWLTGSRRVSFTPGPPGEYEFYCHVKGHAKKGMKGTLVVVP
jgi:plastocyanin